MSEDPHLSPRSVRSDDMTSPASRALRIPALGALLATGVLAAFATSGQAGGVRAATTTGPQYGTTTGPQYGTTTGPQYGTTTGGTTTVTTTTRPVTTTTRPVTTAPTTTTKPIVVPKPVKKPAIALTKLSPSAKTLNRTRILKIKLRPLNGALSKLVAVLRVRSATGKIVAKGTKARLGGRATITLKLTRGVTAKAGKHVLVVTGRNKSVLRKAIVPITVRK